MALAAIDMITDAFRLANIIDENETPSAEQGVYGLRVLNQLMGQWDADGIRLGWVVVTSQAADLPLRFQDERAVKYNLAAELAGEYGVELTPRVAKIAADTRAALSKAHRLRVESDLSLLPDADARCSSGAAIESGGL